MRSDAAGGWLSGIDNTAQQNVHFLSDAEDFSIVSEIIFGANFTSENRFSLKSSSWDIRKMRNVGDCPKMTKNVTFFPLW